MRADTCTHNLEVTDDLTPLQSVCAVHRDGRETECRLHTVGSRLLFDEEYCLVSSAGLVKIATSLSMYRHICQAVYLFSTAEIYYSYRERARASKRERVK